MNKSLSPSANEKNFFLSSKSFLSTYSDFTHQLLILSVGVGLGIGKIFPFQLDQTILLADTYKTYNYLPRNNNNDVASEQFIFPTLFSSSSSSSIVSPSVNRPTTSINGTTSIQSMNS